MKNRVISIFILLVMISSILLSCDTSVSEEILIVDEASVYKSIEIEIPDDFRSNSDNNYKRSVIYCEDKVYLLGRNVINQEEWITEPVLLVYDLNTNTSVMEKITTYNENSGVDHIAFDTQMNQITIESVDGVITLNKMTLSGERIFSFEISSDKQKVITDSSDNIYVAFSDSLESFDSDGNSLNSVPFGNLTYNDFDILSNGRIYIEFTDSYSRLSYKYVQDNKKSLSNTVTKNAKMNMHTGTGYDIYYSDSISFYGYNESDNTLHTLINWMDSGIAHSGIINIYVYSSDRIIYDYRDIITNERSFFIAEKTDEIFETETKDIIIACMRDINKLDAIALNFNKINNEYNVIVQSYVTPDDQSAGATKLNNEILAGNIPDIIIPDYYMPMMSYINKGLFTDMYQFIDNDPELARDSFYDIIFSTYERDGKLYQFLAETSISTLVTKGKNVNGKDTWTYEAFKEFYDSTPNDVIFSEKFARYNLFYILTDTGLGDFVDYKEGTCDFDNDLFINIINIIKSLDEKTYISANISDEEFDDFYMHIPELFKNDKIIVKNASIYNISDFINLLYCFDFEDVTFMGYPSPYGEENTCTLYGTEFMVTEQSTVKNGAWEFIKYYISDDVQLAKSGYYIPTSKSAFKALFEYYQEFHLYINQAGLLDASNREYSDDELTKAGLVPFELKDEYFQMMEKLLNSKNRLYSYDNTLINIVYEEVYIYFKDGKTAEETAKTIQNRASIYLNEIS